MGIRYEVRRQGKVADSYVVKTRKTGSDIIRDFVVKGANTTHGAMVPATAVVKLVDIVGRISDAMGINLLTLIDDKELTEHYYAIQVRDGQKLD